jgi:hypothetical protein
MARSEPKIISQEADKWSLSNMNFLQINDEVISINCALAYLKKSGAYHRVLAEIIRQHILEQELQTKTDIQCNDFQIDQALVDFRVQNDLQDVDAFQEWMQSNSVDYHEFRKNIQFGFKVEQLKMKITESKIESYFQEQKPLLDRVVLSRIILEDKDKANLVKDELIRDRTKFGQLAQMHSITDDRIANGMMGPVSRGQMPDILKAAIDLAQTGDILGPLDIDGRYCIFRIEQLLPAILEGALKQELKNQLFEQWIQEKIQNSDIQLLLK